MIKKKEDKESKEQSYDFKEEQQEETIEQQVEKKLIEEEQRRKKTDDVHILDIAKDLPMPEYMRVELKKAELTTKNDDDKDIKVPVFALPLLKPEKSEPPKDDLNIFMNADGDIVQLYETIFDIDLKQMAEGQISDCASTIFPMLIDEATQLAVDEKKARTPEPRKEPYKWTWVLIAFVLIIMITLITLQILPGLMGGK